MFLCGLLYHILVVLLHLSGFIICARQRGGFWNTPSPPFSFYLVGCLTRWQEASSERSLLQQTVAMPHQTSSEPRGPWWRHSWVDGHDQSLTDRINPPNCICHDCPVSNLCLLASPCLRCFRWPRSCCSRIHVNVLPNPPKQAVDQILKNGNKWPNLAA